MSRPPLVFPALVPFLFASLPGCGTSDDSPAPSQTQEDAGIDVVAEAAVDSPYDAPAPEASVDAPPPDAPAADAPEDVAIADADPDAGYPELTPSDIDFEAVEPLPQGEQLVFNDWNASPNTLVSIQPDGTAATTIFQTFRIWSFGVSHAGDRIAFSCGDPEQAAHYGINLGDAIQHTWLYDVETQTIELQASGNINDECHTFGPGDTNLYVCRRYDFTAAGAYKGWRIGRIALATKQFEFLTADLAHTFDLYPQPFPDESSMVFGRIVWNPPDPQVHSVQLMTLPSGAPAAIRTDGGRPALSPDGTRYVFRKAADNALYSCKLDGTDEIKVSSAAGTDLVWSPQGDRLAYLIWDNSVGCSHIDLVAADGSQADAPVRVRDCSVTGEFMSQLAWVNRP